MSPSSWVNSSRGSPDFRHAKTPSKRQESVPAGLIADCGIAGPDGKANGTAPKEFIAHRSTVLCPIEKARNIFGLLERWTCSGRSLVDCETQAAGDRELGAAIVSPTLLLKRSDNAQNHDRTRDGLSSAYLTAAPAVAPSEAANDIDHETGRVLTRLAGCCRGGWLVRRGCVRDLTPSLRKPLRRWYSTGARADEQLSADSPGDTHIRTSSPARSRSREGAGGEANARATPLKPGTWAE